MRIGWIGLAGLFFLASGVVASPVGIGVYGGLNMPLAQQDASSGFLYGVKLRIVATNIFALEPTLAYFRQGDSQVEVHGQSLVLDGGQSTALGLNVVVGSVGPPDGMRFYGLMGVASHAMRQEGTKDRSRLAVSFGPGLEVRIGRRLTLSLEACLHAISLDGGGARKNIGLSSGLLYYLGGRGR